SSLLIGLTPSRTNPPDDPTVLNLTFTTRALRQSSAWPRSVCSPLSLHSASSNRGTLRRKARSTRRVDNVGVLPVPMPETSTFNQILEVCGLGIVGFSASWLRKRNRFRKV